jgi:hypothetical protein
MSRMWCVVSLESVRETYIVNFLGTQFKHKRHPWTYRNEVYWVTRNLLVNVSIKLSHYAPWRHMGGRRSIAPTHSWPRHLMGWVASVRPQPWVNVCILKKNRWRGDGLEHTPQKSLRCLAQETCTLKSSAAIATKLLKIWPYKVTVVNTLQVRWRWKTKFTEWLHFEE